MAAPLEELMDHLGMDERFVPLPVDPNIGVDLPLVGQLDEPLGARLAIGRGHVVFAVEAFDHLGGFFGVDRKGDVVKKRNFVRRFPHPLEERFAFERRENFLGEAGRLEPGRDDARNFF